jgi:hypothetical protein
MAALQMPFFRVAGNHGIGNDRMRQSWRERYGADYLRLGTAGGVFHHPPAGNLDHLTVVSIRNNQPHLVNLSLAGVLDTDEAERQ